MSSEIARNIDQLKAEIPEGVQLVAVSKTKPVELLLEAYNAGQRAFGENYVQEIVEKQPLMPADAEWHFIGHLQSNKVKFIAPFIHCIHAVDSLKLLNEIHKQAKNNDRIIHCLIQVHIADEESKFGLSADDVLPFFDEITGQEFNHVIIAGLMGMASFTDDLEKVRNEFKLLKNIFGKVKASHYPQDSRFREISMGMSGDWKIAVEEGSTIVRIGSAIFGQR